MQIIENQRTNKVGRKVEKEFLLNGIMFCSKCNARFYGKDSIIKSYWTRADGEKVIKEYSQMKYTHVKSTHFQTKDGSFIPAEFVDAEKMIVKDSIIQHEAYVNQEAIFKTKIGKKVEKVKCNVSELHEKDLLEDILEDFEVLKWNEKQWQKTKSTLFKDETVKSLSLQLKLMREELTKNENRMDKIYDNIESGNYPEGFLQKKLNTLDERNQEIKAELDELEDKRDNWDIKVKSQIDILDKMKNWKGVWEKANNEKRIEMLKLITLRILISTKKVKKDGKFQILRNVEIVYNQAFEELFELGLIEKAKEAMPTFEGGSSGSQCGDNRHAHSAIEDLAFTSRSSRESGKAERRGCIEHGFTEGLELQTIGRTEA